MLVYVAGPYAIGDHVQNVNRALLAGNELLRLGHVPFVPHLSHFWDMLYPHPLADWMAIDMEILRRCDAVLCLPGKSIGAEQEVEFARSLHLPVYYRIEDIPLEGNQ